MSSLPTIGQVLALVVGPYILDALGPLQQLNAWLAANPNADRLQIMGQFDVFLAQERLQMVVGLNAGVANLVTVSQALATQIQAEVQAAITAAQQAASGTASAKK